MGGHNSRGGRKIFENLMNGVVLLNGGGGVGMSKKCQNL